MLPRQTYALFISQVQVQVETLHNSFLLSSGTSGASLAINPTPTCAVSVQCLCLTQKRFSGVEALKLPVLASSSKLVRVISSAFSLIGGKRWV